MCKVQFAHGPAVFLLRGEIVLLPDHLQKSVILRRRRLQLVPDQLTDQGVNGQQICRGIPLYPAVGRKVTQGSLLGRGLAPQEQCSVQPALRQQQGVAECSPVGTDHAGQVEQHL